MSNIYIYIYFFHSFGEFYYLQICNSFDTKQFLVITTTSHFLSWIVFPLIDSIIVRAFLWVWFDTYFHLSQSGVSRTQLQIKCYNCMWLMFSFEYLHIFIRKLSHNCKNKHSSWFLWTDIRKRLQVLFQKPFLSQNITST